MLVCGWGDDAVSLSQIFGGMKDEGQLGLVRGRDQTGQGRAGIISPSPDPGLSITVVTTQSVPHLLTTYAPL